MDVRTDENDPEALWVDAEPQEVATYLGLVDLLRGLQGELDNSWAVLGEIYGGDAKLRELGLTIRRVRSTLDDADRLGARAKYVPVRAKFRTGDELLKLLVGPLYDDNPNIGVRELIQNAVDACREMEDVLAQRRHPVARPNLRRDADVVVFLEELEDGTGCLTVEDNGIGMTPRIICDYFLTAGASFRNCEAWHKQHDDETGTPRVLRSGRFGIGVLAAFLLGNEIHVSTRHVDEERGVAFSCRLEDPEVELRWTDRPVGTTIQIHIGNSRVVDRLVGDGDTPGVDWDCYGLERPRLARGMLLRRTRVPNRHNPSPILTGESWLAPAVSLPSPGSELPAKWRRINYPEFDDLHWTWELPWAMACNGILIGHPNLHASFCTTAGFMDVIRGLSLPQISVFDSRGVLSLNLQRTASWHDIDLTEALCRDVLAFLLVRTASEPRLAMDQLRDCRPREHWNRRERNAPLVSPSLQHPAINLGDNPLVSWVGWTRSGVTLAERTVLRRGGIRFAHIAVPTAQAPMCLPADQCVFLQEDVRKIVLVSKAGAEPLVDVYPRSGARPDISGRSFDPYSDWGSRARGFLLPQESWEASFGGSDVVNEHVSGATTFEAGLTLVWHGEYPLEAIDVNSAVEIASASFQHDGASLWVWLSETPSPGDVLSPLGEAWLSLLGSHVIPFDPEERRARLAHAYIELAEEISRWEQLTSEEITTKAT